MFLNRHFGSIIIDSFNSFRNASVKTFKKQFFSAPPLSFLPGNFLRGASEHPRPLRQNPPPQNQVRPVTQPRLSLGNQVQQHLSASSSSRDPVFIPIPDLLTGVKPEQRMLRRQGIAEDPVDSIRSAGRKFKR